MAIRAEDGNILFYEGTVEDVSGRNQAEEALREMNEILELFLKHSPIYVFIKDEDIRPVYLSANYEKMLGKPMDEILGKNMDDLFPSELSRSMIEDDKRILREGKPCEFIEEFGGRTYSTIKFPIFIQGKAKYLAGYTTDITERRQSEEMLRVTSKRLELALAAAKAGTWDWNVATGFIEWSPQMFELFGLDPRSNNASFASWRTALHPDDREQAESRIELALKQRSTLDSDYRIIWPDGRIRWINALGEGVYDEAGRPVQMIGICQDISDRKQTEEQIRASLREKEVLLKEIHHRVKNNLQVISGLLTLQAAQIDDERLQHDHQGQPEPHLDHGPDPPDALPVGQPGRHRHGRLHPQPGRQPAQLPGPGRHAADHYLRPAAVRLAIDKAIPLALIINELVTNAMKHAFPDGRPGEIRITCECDASGDTACAADPPQVTSTYELIVADNGAGLPAGFDPKNQKSLGLQLVTMLAKQLGGSMAISAGGGTAVRITFSPDEKGKRQS